MMLNQHESVLILLLLPLPTFSISLLLTSQISVYLVFVTSVPRVFSSTFPRPLHSLSVSPHAFASTLPPLIPPVSFFLHAFSSKPLHLLLVITSFRPSLGCLSSFSFLCAAPPALSRLGGVADSTLNVNSSSASFCWLFLTCTGGCCSVAFLFLLFLASLGTLFSSFTWNTTAFSNCGFQTFFRLSCTFTGCPAFKSPSSKTNLTVFMCPMYRVQNSGVIFVTQKCLIPLSNYSRVLGLYWFLMASFTVPHAFSIGLISGLSGEVVHQFI